MIFCTKSEHLILFICSLTTAPTIDKVCHVYYIQESLDVKKDTRKQSPPPFLSSPCGSYVVLCRTFNDTLGTVLAASVTYLYQSSLVHSTENEAGVRGPLHMDHLVQAGIQVLDLQGGHISYNQPVLYTGTLMTRTTY